MKNTFVLNLFVALLTTQLISCSLFTPDPCPKVPQTKNFDFKRVVGDWYVLVTTMRDFKEGDKCHHIKANLFNDRTLEVKSSWIDANGKEMSTAVNDTIKENNPGQVEIGVDVTVSGLLKPYNKNAVINGYIVDTDYSNYLVIYSCGQLDHFWVSQKVDNFLILTKSRSFDSIKRLIPAFGKLAELKVDANSIGFVYNDLSCPN